MFILHYGNDYNKNLIKFKNDLYICLNTLGHNELMEDDIYKYTIEFVKYFDQIYVLISNFDNNIENLKYNVEFKILFEHNIPLIELNSICLNLSPNNLINSNEISNKISNKIKKSDYDKLTNFLGFNYAITVNIDPYYIVKIVKSNIPTYYEDFYIGRLILLKNVNTNESIEINFDTNSLFIYNLNESNELDEPDEIEPNGFKFYGGKLIIYDGPVFKLTKLAESNLIKLDEQIYSIDPISTIGIEQFI